MNKGKYYIYDDYRYEIFLDDNGKECVNIYKCMPSPITELSYEVTYVSSSIMYRLPVFIILQIVNDANVYPNAENFKYMIEDDYIWTVTKKSVNSVIYFDMQESLSHNVDIEKSGGTSYCYVSYDCLKPFYHWYKRLNNW